MTNLKKHLLSAAAVAIALPMAAQAGEKSSQKYGEKSSMTQSQAMDRPENPAEAGVVKFDAPMISAKELLGEGVRGENGERIARIDDIVMNASGQAEKLVFLSGGLFGFGGHHGALSFGDADLTMNEEFEPDIRVGLTEETVKDVAEFDSDEMPEYTLASDIIGSEVDLSTNGDDDEDAVISDVILTQDGMAKHLIVQKSAIATIGAGQKYAVAFDKLQVAQGDGSLVLNLTEEELEASPRYASWETAVAGTWNAAERGAEKAWKKTKQGADKAWDKTEKAADKAWDKTKRGADEVADETGEAAEEAGDEIEETTDSLDN